MKLGDLSRDSVFRLGTVALLIFAQSMPANFISNVLPLVYRTLGMELKDFWIFSIPLIPRWLKWLIAPYVDRRPLLSIGLRRSWILVLTPLSAAAYAVLAIANPTLDNVYLIVFILFWAELVMAVQDISVDAYCVESLGPAESKLSGAVMNLASVFSFTVVSAVLMVLYYKVGWEVAIIAMAGILLVATLPALLRPEPISPQQRETMISHAGRPNLRRTFTRENALPLLSLVAAAAIYTSFTSSLSHTMLIDKGLTIAEIGIASGVGVSIGIILGSLLTGWLLLRFSLKNVCLIACVPLVIAHAFEIGMSLSASVSMTTFMVVAFLVELAVAPHYVLMGTARVRWTTKRQAGTDFTIQSSLRAICMAAGGAIAGPVAHVIGWPLFFCCGIALGVGATLLMYFIHDRMEATNIREMEEDNIGQGNTKS